MFTFFRKLWEKVSKSFKNISTPRRFLCDSCLYDYHTACNNPERPNVTDCPDYKKRGGGF
jgi:hypothetical protein